MTTKTYRTVKKIIFLILFLIVFLLINNGLQFFSFFILALGMFILSLLKTRVDGVLEDERQLQMAGKAAQLSFQVLLPILMLMSLALLTGRQDAQSFYVTAVGMILAYISILALLIYIISYFYFEKKSRGK